MAARAAPEDQVEAVVVEVVEVEVVVGIAKNVTGRRPIRLKP